MSISELIKQFNAPNTATIHTDSKKPQCRMQSDHFKALSAVLLKNMSPVEDPVATAPITPLFVARPYTGDDAALAARANHAELKHQLLQQKQCADDALFAISLSNMDASIESKYTDAVFVSHEHKRQLFQQQCADDAAIARALSDEDEKYLRQTNTVNQPNIDTRLEDVLTDLQHNLTLLSQLTGKSTI